MSHYKHNYPKWGLQPNDNFKPIDPSTVVKGMNLAKDTIYKKDFDKKTVNPEPLRK